MDHAYTYSWPPPGWTPGPAWRGTEDGRTLVRSMPEEERAVSRDSRWPAFFPTSLSIASTSDGTRSALERISGASIVNRFPLILAISVCRKDLSPRHHARRSFMHVLEHSGHCAVQFANPGQTLDALLGAISDVPEAQTDRRIAYSGLATRPGVTGPSPVFADSYLVYEGRLAEPARDFDGAPIFPAPWIDVGSHRVYFLEVRAIQLRSDVACGRARIHWRSLPEWNAPDSDTSAARSFISGRGYVKGFTPHYEFPSSSTVSFEADEHADGMAVRMLPAYARDQVEMDDDRARWPCFFPSSVGMITTWADAATPNLMPCGSTTVVSRSPLTVAACISYARINRRYAPRATLEIARRTGRFGCGVPFLRHDVVQAIRIAGTRSVREDVQKVAATGLEVQPEETAPRFAALPLHFDCAVTGEVRMGTHVMLLGEVRTIYRRVELNAQNPLRWRPWAEVRGGVSEPNFRRAEAAVVT